MGITHSAQICRARLVVQNTRVKKKKVREKKYGGADVTLANDAPWLVGTGVILLEQVSSQIILEAIMNVEMKRQ